MSPTQTDIRQRMRNYIEDNFLYMSPDVELRDDEDLLASGAIDSLGFLELVEEVQESFGIEVGDVEITTENFGSINAMSAFIERKTAG